MPQRDGTATSSPASVGDSDSRRRRRSEGPSRDRLWTRLTPAWRWGLLAALLSALAANVAALLVPFLEMKEAFHASLSYELPAAVGLMWREGLPVVAALILVFSIVFPLAKLAGLLSALLMRWPPHRRATLVRGLAILGRWSLLDVFVVMLLMVLASGQWAISTEVRPGVHLFMLAIGIAMTAAEIMASFDSPRSVAATSSVPSAALASVGWTARIAIPLLLLGSAVALGLALVAPMLRIHQFLLASDAYSVGSAIATLWRDGRELFAFLMAVLLGGLPALRLLCLAGAWLPPLGSARSERLASAAGLVGRFAGLEVFGLALLLVLVEGRDLIRTEIEAGAWFLLAAIALNGLFTLVARGVLRGVGSRSATGAA